jgi:hypothetical protein
MILLRQSNRQGAFGAIYALDEAKNIGNLQSYVNRHETKNSAVDSLWVTPHLPTPASGSKRVQRRKPFC